MNLYDYSLQNPLRYIDPEGTNPYPQHGIGNPFQQYMASFRAALTVDLGRDPTEVVEEVITPSCRAICFLPQFSDVAGAGASHAAQEVFGELGRYYASRAFFVAGIVTTATCLKRCEDQERCK